MKRMRSLSRLGFQSRRFLDLNSRLHTEVVWNGSGIGARSGISKLAIGCLRTSPMHSEVFPSSTDPNGAVSKFVVFFSAATQHHHQCKMALRSPLSALPLDAFKESLMRPHASHVAALAAGHKRTTLTWYVLSVGV